MRKSSGKLSEGGWGAASGRAVPAEGRAEASARCQFIALYPKISECRGRCIVRGSSRALYYFYSNMESIWD